MAIDKNHEYRRRFDYDGANMFRCCGLRSALKASAAFATWTRIDEYRVKSGAHASVWMKTVSGIVVYSEVDRKWRFAFSRIFSRAEILYVLPLYGGYISV